MNDSNATMIVQYLRPIEKVLVHIGLQLTEINKKISPTTIQPAKPKPRKTQ